METPLAIPDHFTIQFDTNWKSVCQQKNARMKSRVHVRTGITGERSSFNYYGPMDAEDVTGERFKKVNLRDLSTAKRWISPRQYQLPTGESKWDEKALLPTISPTGAHVITHTAAYGRRLDDAVLEALGGTSYAGALGVTPVDLPASQIIAKDYVYGGSSANSALKVEKILAALRKLTEAEAWNDEYLGMGLKLNGVMTPLLEESLRIEASSKDGSRLFSRDFMPPVLNEEGKIKRFLGIDWDISTRPALRGVTDTTVDFAYIWVSDGVLLDIWEDMGTTIDRRSDLSNAVQFLSQYQFGAARLEEEKVVKIAGVVR